MPSKLEAIRKAQEALVKSENATQCPQEWTVDGSAAKGRKMVKEHAKLMLRAFNGDCDAAIAETAARGGDRRGGERGFRGVSGSGGAIMTVSIAERGGV